MTSERVLTKVTMPGTSEPPAWVIETARRIGARSPCQKSKRGAVAYDMRVAVSIDLVSAQAERAEGILLPTGADGCGFREIQIGSDLGAAHNSPPPPLQCTGSAECRKNCAKICNHAESQALMIAYRAVRHLEDLAHVALVHAKVVDGKVVPGGTPLCWQCSRLVADLGIAGIWLYEIDNTCPSDKCRMCTGEMCWQCPNPGSLNRCEHGSLERHEGFEKPDGNWKFYNPGDFNRHTHRACEIHQ